MFRTITIAAIALLLTGCGTTSAPEPSASTSSPAGIANPASEYCESLGGTVVIKDTEAGQVGICNLPDGRSIDEWDLYRADHPTDGESATS